MCSLTNCSSQIYRCKHIGSDVQLVVSQGCDARARRQRDDEEPPACLKHLSTRPEPRFSVYVTHSCLTLKVITKHNACLYCRKTWIVFFHIECCVILHREQLVWSVWCIGVQLLLCTALLILSFSWACKCKPSMISCRFGAFRNNEMCLLQLSRQSPSNSKQHWHFALTCLSKINKRKHCKHSNHR